MHGLKPPAPVSTITGNKVSETITILAFCIQQDMKTQGSHGNLWNQAQITIVYPDTDSARNWRSICRLQRSVLEIVHQFRSILQSRILAKGWKMGFCPGQWHPKTRTRPFAFSTAKQIFAEMLWEMSAPNESRPFPSSKVKRTLKACWKYISLFATKILRHVCFLKHVWVS